MRRMQSISVILFEAAVGIGLVATTTPTAAQYAPPTAPTCACGPSAMPAYVPPTPNAAARPLDGTPRGTPSGVSYREARGFQAARTNLGTSGSDKFSGPALFAGSYAGVHGGWAVGQTSVQDPRLGVTDTFGGLLGLHLGNNWQSGAFVFGVEGDADWNFADGRRTFASGDNVQSKRDWTTSLRGRAGYAFGPLLAYGTLGGAIAGHTTAVTLPGWSKATAGSAFGYVYGGGLEWQATKALTLRGEVLRYEFNDRTLTLGSGATAPLKLDDTVVRGGLTYRFN